MRKIGKLIIEGNSVYEVDEECVRKKQGRQGEQETERYQTPDENMRRQKRRRP